MLLLQPLDRQCRPGWKLDQGFRAIDQFAVQLAARVARDAPAWHRRRVPVDLPFLQRSGIQDVLVAATHHDHWIVGRNGVEVVAVWQPLLLQLRFMPVAVGDDHLARATAFHTSIDRRKHIADRTRAGQVHSGSAAGIVQVIVGQAGYHGPAFQIDGRGAGARELLDAVGAADRREPAVRDRHRLRDGKARVDGHDVTVDQNGVGLSQRRRRKRERRGRRKRERRGRR